LSRTQVHKLEEKSKRLPRAPGVYLMKNVKGRVIYVGKAKDIFHRVRSYFQKREALDIKTKSLMDVVKDIDYIATENEVEALVLECNLIKEYRPKYNIRLKDDKRYPFIKLTINEKFPRLMLVRRVEKDGAEYFGPYTDIQLVRRTLRFIKTIFPLRDCIGGRFGTGKNRECLNFHIKRCLAPCTGKVKESEYEEIVEQVRLFLRGRNKELLESLRSRMLRLSKVKRYEEAAIVRDQIESYERITQHQLAVSPGGREEDVVALAREGNMSCGVVMKIREGKILGSEAFLVPAKATEKDSTVFNAFFELYYHAATDIPPRIYVQVTPLERELLCDWLSERIGRTVTITQPHRGEKKKLVELAHKNATLKIMLTIRDTVRSASVMRAVKQTLDLPSTPFRIEVYDISNIHGTAAVGSMVTFENGRPFKSGYRHFKIREVEGANDFAMLEEVLRRRLRHLKESGERSPDLIMVDGGRGQVSAARKALSEVEIGGIPVIGLAKKKEEIYLETRKEPLALSRRNNVLRLLQRMRDEAHRFAVEYHRKLMSRKIEHSALDDIPGIGEKRKMLLLIEFGSVEALSKASAEEIATTPGIGGTVARKIFEYLHKQ